LSFTSLFAFVFTLSFSPQLPITMSPTFAVAEDDVFTDYSPTSLNRYSMPVTRSRTGFYDFSSLDQTNTTRFLFGEEEEHTANGETNKMYHQTANANVTGLDESFPTLTRSEGQTNMVSCHFLAFLSVISPYFPLHRLILGIVGKKLRIFRSGSEIPLR
jgi:hypothetical protein